MTFNLGFLNNSYHIYIVSVQLGVSSCLGLLFLKSLIKLNSKITILVSSAIIFWCVILIYIIPFDNECENEFSINCAEKLIVFVLSCIVISISTLM